MTDLIRRDVVAVLDDLPEVCFSRLNTTGQPVILRRGSVGYFPTDPMRDVEKLNADLTAAQIMAMEVGSMMGFHVPAADPLELSGACGSVLVSGRSAHALDGVWRCARRTDIVTLMTSGNVPGTSPGASSIS